MGAPHRTLRLDLAMIQAGGGVSTFALGDGELWGSPEPWGTLARWGGSALGLAALRAHAGSSAGPCLALAVGEGVRRGLPTAARAAVLGRAPLSGLYSEGHIGGQLGPRLAGLADALLLTGTTTRRGAVLVVDAGEPGGPCRVELLARPDLRGCSPAESVRALEQELGPCAVLAVGPAGERGLPFAGLASGHSPPSFVGRGGLGALFGALGLKALCLRAPLVVPASDASARALRARLTQSPRLAARAEGGTLELFDTLAASGELGRDVAHGLAGEARRRADARHGCRGCPTPCGWVFERSDGVRQGARFGASRALGVALGLESLDDALHLLGLCDALGMDAKEAGAVLALQCLARERGKLPGKSARGDRAALARALEALVWDAEAPGRAGAAALAREVGLVDEVPVSRGQAVGPRRNRAALLGQCVGSGGADPMRTFPFLLESAELERVRTLLAPLPVPAGALDPDSGVGKGRMVFWHENLVSAVDLSGFCSFSAAGLVGDGLASLDELAEWILPEALMNPDEPAWRDCAPGERLLAAGASLVLARHLWNQELGMAPREPPTLAGDMLDEPGMLGEYRALRGQDPTGRVRPEARARIGTPELVRVELEGLGSEPHGVIPEAIPEAAPEPVLRPLGRGRVTVCASGSLGALLGAERELELELPVRLERVLAHLAHGDADVERRLFDGQQVIPAIWRAGRRLSRRDAVHAGDRLELVLAIAGG